MGCNLHCLKVFVEVIVGILTSSSLVVQEMHSLVTDTKFIIKKKEHWQKKIKFSSYIRKFRGLGTKKYVTNFLIYDFAPNPVWISLYINKHFIFFFISEMDSFSKEIKYNREPKTSCKFLGAIVTGHTKKYDY